MKIGLQITARLKSSRLPMKLLLDLNGYSIVEHVIERSKLIRGVDEIVVCTSQNSQDKPLVEIALKRSVYSFLGSEEDVLQRLLDSAKFFNFDYILCITGENPLFSVEHTNRIVDAIRRDKSDFVFFDGLPIGCSVYGLNVKALEVICQVKKEIDTEIWGPLVNRPEIFKVTQLQAEEFYSRNGLRITTDYFEDYQFISGIFRQFPKCSIPSLYDALCVLDNNPEMLEIHKNRQQASVPKEVMDRIDVFYKENKERILEIKRSVYES